MSHFENGEAFHSILDKYLGEIVGHVDYVREHDLRSLVYRYICAKCGQDILAIPSDRLQEENFQHLGEIVVMHMRDHRCEFGERLRDEPEPKPQEPEKKRKLGVRVIRI